MKYLKKLFIPLFLISALFVSSLSSSAASFPSVDFEDVLKFNDFEFRDTNNEQYWEFDVQEGIEPLSYYATATNPDNYIPIQKIFLSFDYISSQYVIRPGDVLSFDFSFRFETVDGYKDFPIAYAYWNTSIDPWQSISLDDTLVKVTPDGSDWIVTVQFYHVFSAAYPLNRLYVVLDAGSASNIEGVFTLDTAIINPTISNFVIESSSSPTAPTYPDNSEFKDIVADYKETEEDLMDSISDGVDSFDNMFSDFAETMYSFREPLLLVTSLFTEFVGSSSLYNNLLSFCLSLGFVLFLFSLVPLIIRTSSDSRNSNRNSNHSSKNKGGGS